ncbi:MAG: valine--tRNA ligase [Methanomethylophilus sp.]|jgi:valyl-tRNA synthetase
MAYDSSVIEKKWEEMWKEKKVYRFDPKSDKPVFSIDNPPRYTSGDLHLGHATGYSLIDFAARYHRMKGDNVFFPLCFDVNGTPIEVRVEKKYGITKKSLPRQDYRKLCSDWANGYIAKMTHDFEMLGESMDPSIYYQTDAPYYRSITQLSFVKLFNRGLVYKANFPVNWCPRCGTALADAEVDYKDNVNKLNYLKFAIAGDDGQPSGEYMMIATTRPELLCTCKVVAVNPADPVNSKYVGRELITPIYGRHVKVISDPKVDMEYGTGNVMICTIGDKADLEWIMKYHLELEKGIDEEGKMTQLAGKYAGMPVAEARQAAIEDLKAMGVLVKQEDNPQQVSVCWRCKTPIEYLQVPQWFLKTTTFKDAILKRANEINWYPDFMKVRLEDWTKSLEWDWVLSRQRIFATPVPIWECKKCGHAVCATEEQARKYVDPTVDKPPVDKCPECGCTEFVGCTDVFDTWMDSSGSALYNTYWERDPELHKKLFPMTLRPQSHDIIRTWAFYSILRTEQIEQSIPWKNIMIHGFIMAPDGTPMHTSAGNVIDPVPILKKYGADALRYYAATCSLGIDHAFREKDVVRGKKICIKVYNLGQFVSRYFEGMTEAPKEPGDLRTADKWILGRLAQTVKNVTDCFEVYQFDKAMKYVEEFIWHVFADDYVEMVKGRDDAAVKYTLYKVFLDSIKLLAPFMPHITEDVYQNVYQKFDGAVSVHVTSWPVPGRIDEEAVKAGDAAAECIAAVRAWKAERKINVNAEISALEIIGGDSALYKKSEEDIRQGARAKSLSIAEKADLVEKVASVKPVYAKLGPAFKGQAKAIAAAIAAADPEDLAKQLDAGKAVLDIEGGKVEVGPEFFEVKKSLSLNGREVSTVQCGDALLVIEQ